MNMTMPDSLSTIDRTPSFAGIVATESTGNKDAAVASGRGGGKSFADILNNQRAVTGLGTSASKSTSMRPSETATEALNNEQTDDEAAEQHATAEKAAEGLISNALILPILKQVRRSSFGENTVFSGGNGEKAFGPEFDMQLADRIAKSPRLGVKTALVAKLEKHHAVTTASATKTSAKTNAKPPQRLDVNG